MKKTVLIFALTITSIVMYAQADYSRFVRDVDRYSRDYSNNQVVSLYQNHYGIPHATLIQLYGISGRSWGNVALGLEISHFLGIPIGDVFDFYDGRRGWGITAQRLGIKPGSAQFHQMKSIMRSKNRCWREIYRDYGRGRDPIVARRGRIIFDDGMIIIGPSSKDIKRINKQIEKQNKEIYKEQRKREREWEKRNRKIRREQKKQQKRYGVILGERGDWDDWDDWEWDD